MLKFYATLLLASGLQLMSHAQTCAPPLAYQEPYIITNNTVPIEQYLTRALAMERLQYQWYVGGAANRDSTRSEINMAVQLKAAILLRAAGLWGDEERYNSSDYLTSLQTFVQEVNQRYDCAGVRRPLIQANVFTEEVSQEINMVVIQPAVISEFRSEIAAAGQTSDYYDANGQPRTNRTYSYSLVGIYANGVHARPDAHRLEGRMWIYQQARYYLNAGFTALHMGQAALYSNTCVGDGSVDRDCTADNGAGLAWVENVMRRIRTYYTTLPGRANAYLLLTSEPNNTWNGNNIKLARGTSNGLANLIFDWNLGAARPRETSGPNGPQLDSRQRTGSACPYADDAAQSFDGTPLANSTLLMATIDPCHGIGMLPDGGGITPSGRVFSNEGATPYSVYLDFGTDKPVVGSMAYDPGEFTPTNEGTWGYDDARWFSYGLPATARGPWTQVQLKRVRTFIESESFLQVTGRAYGHTNPGRGYRDGTVIDIPAYRLRVDNAARQSIAQAWEVLNPEPQWQPVLGGGYTGQSCVPSANKVARPFPGPEYSGKQRYYALQMNVQNPDVTSIYTWHIQRPDKSWEPMTYGQSRTFYPRTGGTYIITLKQDNLGLPNGQTARPFTHEFTPDTYCEAQAESSQRNALVTTSSIEQLQLQVFPQPNTGQATIQLASSGPLAVTGTVEDILGRQVLTVAPHQYPYAGAHNLDLDLHALPAGVYTCQLTINGSRRTVKLVKN